MPQAHLYAHWRDAGAPLVLNQKEARVSNGVVHVGDAVRELPALHHIQPCACTLCREKPEADRVVRVHAIGVRNGLEYVVLPGAYECPALEVERIDS
jgi:hypothetical protein